MPQLRDPNQMTPRKPFNPFEHHHDHDHAHGDGQLEQYLDPAQQSLADALRVSFGILKIVMIVLVVVYLFSGIFNVKSGENAVRLRFGKIVADEQGTKVLVPGGPYFAWPYPIEQVIRIPVSARTVKLDRQFWFQLTEADVGKTHAQIAETKQGPLNPERDGSMLAGDANIIHARWTVQFQVTDPGKYVQRVGNTDLADDILRNVAEQGVVAVVAQTTADQLIKGQINKALAMARMQQNLDAMGVGLKVTDVAATTAMPMSVKAAYDAVVTAESDKAQEIERAQQDRSKILGDTVGEAHRVIWDLIQDYEVVLEKGQTQQVAAMDQTLDSIFTSLRTGPEHGDLRVGGDVARMINEAQSYRTAVVEQVKSEADTFEQLLPQYLTNPRIVLSRRWLDAKETVLSGDVETFYLDGNLYLELNRDPKLTQKRERERIAKEEEERQARRRR